MLHFNKAEQPLKITRDATFQTGIKTHGKIQNARTCQNITDITSVSKVLH